MSDELIRKSDVFDLMENCGMIEGDSYWFDYLWDEIEKLQPVNAVELPCKVGNMVYEIIGDCGWVDDGFICSFVRKYDYPRCKERIEGKCKAYIETTQFKSSHLNRVGKSIFLTYAEAEKALEDLKNEHMYSYAVCSECGANNYAGNCKYCFGCGAKMEGDE